MNELLEKIGLTKSEIKVYEALLELGSTSTGKIVDKANVASSKIYEILDKLIDKGLANYIVESGIKKFDAAPPERLMEYMKEKEAEIDKQKEELENIIPELKLKQTLSKYKSSAKIYRGMKGVENAFYEALDLLKDPATDEMLVMGAPIKRSNLEYRFFAKFAIEREKRRFPMRAIFNEKARTTIESMYSKYEFTKLKFDKESTGASIDIFNDRVIIYPKTKIEPMVVVIDDASIAESFRVQFKVLWDQNTQTYEGKEAIQNLFREMVGFGDYSVLAENFLITEVLGEEFFIWWQEEKERKGVKSKGVMNSQHKGSIRLKEKTSTDFKYLDNYDSPGATFIFKDKVINLIYSENPIAIKVNNKELAKNYQGYFDILWNQDISTINGFKKVTKKYFRMLDSLNKDDEYFVLGASLEGGDKNMQKFLDKFHDQRIKQKTKVKFLTSYEAYEPIQQRTIESGDAKGKITQIKKLPPDFTTPFQINLFKGDTVWFTLWDGEIRCFEIKSKEVYNNFKTYFDALWNQDISTFTGEEGVKIAYEDLLYNAKKDEDVYLFAAKPQSESIAKYNISWGKRITKLTKSQRAIYYGSTEENKLRVKEFQKTGFQTKIISSEEKTPLSTTIIGNKITYIIWGDKPIVIAIENDVIAKSLKENFNLLWNQETTISKGFNGLRNDLMELYDDLEKHNISYNVIGAAFGRKGQSDEYGKFFQEMYDERKKRKINGKLLFEQGTEKLVKEYKNYKHKDKVRHMPYDTDSPVAFLPGHEKTLILVQGDKPTTITINNKEVTKSFQNNFMSLWNQETRIIKGLDSVENLFNEILEYGHADFFAARGYFFEKRPEFMKSWTKRAEKKKFKLRNIVDKGAKDHPITKLSFVKTKYNLPKEIANMSVYWIFGEKVAIANWMGDEPIVIIIENKEFHELYKQQFDELWNKD